MSRKKPSLVCTVPRLPQLFQQPDEVFQIALRQMAQQLAVQGEQRLIELSQGCGCLVCERHIDDPTILVTAQPVDKACLLQPVDKAGDPRDDGDGAAGDLQNGQRLALAPQDAQDVVLRGGQAVFPQQPGQANLQ